MKLYIANATKQIHTFAYLPVDPRSIDRNLGRVPGLRFINIPIGGQILLPDDFAEADMNYVIAQHMPYGMIEYDEVDRQKKLITLLYAVDRTVPASAIEKAVKQNNDFLVRRGQQIRSEAAVANNEALANSLALQDRRETLGKLEVAVIEENHDPRNDVPALSEGVRVVADRDQAPPPARQRRSARS